MIHYCIYGAASINSLKCFLLFIFMEFIFINVIDLGILYIYIYINDLYMSIHLVVLLKKLSE